jgi:hypothetical protein
MPMDTPIREPLAEATHECIAPIPIVSTTTGFTPFDVEQICRILVHMAI